MRREAPPKTAVVQFRLSLAGTALRLASRTSQKKVEHKVQLVSGANFTAGKPRGHVKGADNCERLLGNSTKEALAPKGFAKTTVRIGGGFSISGAVCVQEECFGGFMERVDDGLVA